MEPINVDNAKAQMRKGILEYCILLILSRGDSYAPKIIAELKNARMIVVEGTLYPILTRQKNQGTPVVPLGRVPAGPSPQILLHHGQRPRGAVAARCLVG